MGQKWDGGSIAFQSETWAAVAEVMRPGAFLLAFGGTRTYHRLVCAIEDAGFVIQDLVAWMYGSGFPKRHDMLKPALEPICLAYKPGGDRLLDIDGCRIPTEDVVVYRDRKPVEKSVGWSRPGHGNKSQIEKQLLACAKAESLGRFPANVIHDGSDDVVQVFSDGAARFFYTAKADAEDRQASKHPTVKPVSLMRCLVTPPGGTVLDPFAGTGSTGAAAILEGVDSVLIERETEYVADIERKLAYYRNRRARTLY